MESNGPPRDSTVSDEDGGNPVAILLATAAASDRGPPLRIDFRPTSMEGLHRSSHSVQSTHFHTGPRSFLEDLRHRRSVKTAFAACPPTAAVLRTLRSAGTEF
jgi:hypothetical protein